ncbi:DUF6522 family protein [Aurantimonas sp. VKM B-3413]|uniref:DUF6522 family protein n=1 Tax=Aurantimonas sp. VKM B-3413 TaxID=2779401 RepID=UPI001E49AA5E|nr:DUF6522 family protein [Aurantimonas sp. VKM B-3413]MCB8836774.1 DUF6522 family protein [Aurantimonas sp. VKM B-3413]
MTQITPTPDGFDIEAALVAEGFELPVGDVQLLMREGKITSRLDQGGGEDAGTFRLVFFHRGTRLTLIVDESGQVLRRSSIAFAGEELPAALHRPAP